MSPRIPRLPFSGNRTTRGDTAGPIVQLGRFNYSVGLSKVHTRRGTHIGLAHMAGRVSKNPDKYRGDPRQGGDPPPPFADAIPTTHFCVS